MESSATGPLGPDAVARGVLEAPDRTGLVLRVVEVQGFSTLEVDRVVVVDDDGRQRGDWLGAAGSRHLQDIAARYPVGARPPVFLERFTIHGSEVAEAGLSCGGEVQLIGQPTDAIPAEVWQRLAHRQPVALVSWIQGAGAGRVLAVEESGRTWGDLGAGPDGATAVTEALAAVAGGNSVTRLLEEAGGTFLVEAWIPSPRLVVVGSGDLVAAIDAQATLLGWETTAVEDQPDGDRWASLEDAFGWAGGSGALIVLTHDPHVDVPALAAGLDAGISYLGAMGSRRTQSRRIDRLTAIGRTEAELDQIHRPIGLDLGGRSAAEVALAIAAEVLADRRGRTGRPLRERTGPIRG